MNVNQSNDDREIGDNGTKTKNDTWISGLKNHLEMILNDNVRAKELLLTIFYPSLNSQEK